MKILISAVEPSADALGAALADSLRKKLGDLTLLGCGGPMLEKQGLKSLFDIQPFSVVGPTGALRAVPAARKAARMLAEAAKNAKPDAAIFIDSWSFSRLAADKVKRAAPAITRIKYVAPQVWASRPGRSKTVASLFDALICLFDFEAPFFEQFGVPVQVAGHSGFQDARANRGNRARFREAYDIGNAPLLAVLPGSRRSEVEIHAEPFGEILGLLKKEVPDFNVVISAAPAVADLLPNKTKQWPAPVIIVGHADRYNAFAAADAALAVSGTVTTELAINETPMVVCYKMDPLSALWVDLFVTAPYASLLNIAAGKMVAPEFVQRNFNAPDAASALAGLLRPGAKRDAQLAAFPGLIDQLAGTGAAAADKAAQAIIEWAGRKSPKTIE